ncbi:MAG: hypothetical protein IJ220_00800 [Clostridia bacterium]|nr:hypothetical protein [Clostridia bacterium]
MFTWFCSLSNSNKIELFSILASLITSIVAIIISIKTLKQSNNAIIESSRANIVFYIDTLTGNQQFLVIKNFGNSVGKLTKLEITPKLDYTKHPNFSKPNPVLVDYENVLLAPNQSVRSWFPFSKYPDKHFDVHIEYKTLGKKYDADYPIDLSYIEAIDYLYKSPSNFNDEKSALADIGNTLRRISEK